METTNKNISIPIKVKNYVGYTIQYKCRNAEKIVFPAEQQAGLRLIEIGRFYIEDFDHNARFVKEHQRISVATPFCINGEPHIKEFEINSIEPFSVFIIVDEIEELKKSQNIQFEYKFKFEWHECSDLSELNKIKVANEQSIKPYVAHAIPDISFKPSESLQKGAGANYYNVNYAPEDTKDYRFKLGNIVVGNLQKIPYINTDGHLEQVAYPNLRVALTYKSEDGKSHDTGYINVNNSFDKNVSVEIPNGEDDVFFNLYVDWNQWKNGGNPSSLLLRIFTKNWKEPLYECNFLMTPQYYDDVYALDLGTSGIVVAKEKEGKLEIVILDDDKSDPIESDPEIISSLTMLVTKGKEKSKIELSPAANKYYSKPEGDEERFRLVPSKFIIGQERIPYLQGFYKSCELNKNVELFGLDNSEIELVDTNSEEENQRIISGFIGALYKSIFKRFSKETSQIKKLVITYPNTYTIEHLDSIKSILREELKLDQNGQITFVPESDAVAAYYFDQKIMHNGGFCDAEGDSESTKYVVIYDMGAGTLELSLIKFHQLSDGHITASIINNIGIPLAGNYLNYIIYKTLLDEGKIKEKNKDNKAITDNTINGITEGVKRNYVETGKSIIELSPSWYTEYQDYLNLDGNDTYKSLFEKSLEEFLKCCSETILELLIPKIDKGKKIIVDTIVFSGRASQFSGLREKVKDAIEKHNGNKTVEVDELLPTGNCGDYLKTCAAIGALKYQSFFNNNTLFKFENKNLYSKIAVVYWGKKENKYGVCVELLVDPSSSNEHDAELINGTWCKEFSGDIEIKNHIPGKYLYYIQTSLDEERIGELFKKVYLNDISIDDDLNWAFVNILYKYRMVGSKPFRVSLKVSKDNKIIERRIGSKWLLDKKLLENIEDNILYKRSMWPFITKLKD